MSIKRSNFCDCSDAYILSRGTITVPNTAATGAAVNNANKKVIFKNCAPFTDCLTEINNTQVGDAQNFDLVTPMYNLRKYSDGSLRTSRSLWQYYRGQPSFHNSGNVIYFPDGNNNTALFKFKQKITGQTGNDGIKDIEIMFLLKYLSNFCRTLEMPLINCEISLQLKFEMPLINCEIS